MVIAKVLPLLGLADGARLTATQGNCPLALSLTLSLGGSLSIPSRQRLFGRWEPQSYVLHTKLLIASLGSSFLL